MGMKVKILVLAVVLSLGTATVTLLFPEKSVRHEPGILCPDEPDQGEADRGPWLAGDYMITPLASFDARVLVLHRENYHFGKESDLSPTDLAVGWGSMSNQAVVDCFSISQGHRRFSWSADVLPIPRRSIESSASNMHIIPASEDVSQTLDNVCTGSIVRMKGYLVKVTEGSRWSWVSSLRRTDTGDGACEVVWVDTLQIENPS